MWWTPFGFLLMLWVGECFGTNQPTHCWTDSRNCTGGFLSFGQESECCKQGGKSYIKCSDKEFGKILKQINKPQHCVPCPAKPTKIASKPKGKCLPSTCPKRSERCVESQGTTKCIKCNLNCDNSMQPVCGGDKKTYKNECSMICTSKANTRIAYQGPCKANPTCSSITCKKGFTCLLTKLGEVRCTYASTMVCGINGRTYASIADLQLHACQKGFPALYKRRGPCKPADKPTVVRQTKCTNSNPWITLSGLSGK